MLVDIWVCSRYSETGIETQMDVPWVTKLPKLRPTMQCHVGPFLSSNYHEQNCQLHPPRPHV